MGSNDLIISTLFIYLTTYASLYFAVGAAARNVDENKLDYGNEEFGSGSSSRIDEENLAEIGFTHAGLDDEDYSYMEEQLSPTSHRIVLDLPSPTPAFQFESSETHLSEDGDDILPTPAIAMVASNNMMPLQPSILSTFSIPFSALPMGSQARMSSNLNDWIHVGSGDSIDIAPTPRIDVSSYVPNTMTVQRANSPPTVSKPISKILVPGGQLKKHRVDTHFNDVNDLSLRYAVATADEWIYTVGNEIIMLPTVEDVSEYRFNVTAQDPQGLMARTDLIISVRQPSKSRQWYFYFEFSFPYFYNWREVMFNNMSAGGHENFIVTKVKKEGNRINLQYVNETLMEFDACPVEKIQAVTDTYKKIYPDFHNVLLPEKICESFRVVNASKTSNYPPSIKNQIDFINCSAGELFVQKVPDDFCYDPEEGSTANLQLALVDFNQDPLKPNNWLQFDAKNREFYGIYVNSSNEAMSPAADKSTGGTSGGKYVLVCSDSHGKSAVDVLDTWISMPDEQYNAEFSLHFHTNLFGPLQIRKFVEKLGSLFNSTSSHIKIKSYTVDSNVVHFTWFNKSNPGEKEITQLRKVLFSNEGPVDKKVVELFSPDYNITGGNIVPTGRLIGEDTVFHFQTNAPIDSMSETSDRDGELEEEVSVYSNYSGYLVTYIVPSVLIAVMVLLSLIIACLLSRKKKIPGEGSEIRKVGGGVPVIFQDELEAEHPLLQSSSAAPPPPPPHGTGTSGSSRAPPAPSPMYGNNAGTPSSAKYSHPPGYKSVSKYEPPMPPVQYSSSANKYHHSSNNSGILPPPYVPP